MQNVGEEESYMQGFGGKPKGKRPLGRPRRRWKEKIEISFQEVGWEHRPA
jgi:hypothetical protein